MAGILSEDNKSQKSILASLLIRVIEKILITSGSVAVAGFFVWVLGFPQPPTFLLRFLFAFLLLDLISWGLDRLSQHWNYRHSKSIVYALTPLISIVAFWAIFCRCPFNVILSDGHWRILALLLLYPAYKVFCIFWEILSLKTAKQCKGESRVGDGTGVPLINPPHSKPR